MRSYLDIEVSATGAKSLSSSYQPVAESSIPKSGPAPYWRFTMVTKRMFKSDAFEAIHTGVEGMYAAGSIDKETMRTFDEACLSVRQELTPGEIKALRE